MPAPGENKETTIAKKKKIPQFTTVYIFLLVVRYCKWIDVTANLQKDKKK